MLNPNAEKVCLALESGEFTQAYHFLRKDENCFCFLGVVYEVYRRETGDGEWVPHQTELMPVNSYSFQFSGISAPAHGLHQKIADWIGFNSAATYYYQNQGDRFPSSLVVRNDQNKDTLPQIAALIRSKPPGLFKE